MRRIAWGLLLLFAFAIPWEYSLDLGEPFGNIARIAGILLLLAAIPAVLQSGRLRTPGAMQWLVLVFYLCICFSYLWTIDSSATLERIRAYFQELMVVWLVWELAEDPANLRALFRATVAGSWVLALLTLANFASADTIAEGQIRFAASGQDPNDVARFLVLAFPVATLLYDGERHWWGKAIALGYLPVGLMAVILTASRGGALAATVALIGCGILLARRHVGRVVAGIFAMPLVAAGFWFTVPRETFQRLATIPEQIGSGDLNQRWNIWTAGWNAFTHAPLLGNGAGSFVAAAGTAPMDTAHNSALAILVEGGLCTFAVATAVVVVAVFAVARTRGTLRVSLTISLLTWLVTAMASTVHESRTTWLLLAMIALAGRLAQESPELIAAQFPDKLPHSEPATLAETAL